MELKSLSFHILVLSIKENCLKTEGDNQMISISLCMIIKNEEEVLARCLDSIKDVVDEIVIVDTGSSDASIEIAKKYSDKVFSYTWIDNFADARNYAFSFATKDYCMWMDADDVMLEVDKKKLRELKENLNPQTDLVMMKYNTAFDEEGNPTFSYYRERLMKRSDNFLWEGVIHEVITPRGIVIYENIAMTHKKMRASDPKRNLRIFENILAQGMPLSTREQFYYARELYYHKRFVDAIQQFTLFLESGRGWIENNIDACKMRGYCYYENGQENLALQSFLQTFRYDNPRAEVCCDIGKHFLDRRSYQQAIFWYKSATSCERNDESGAFVQPECYDFIPYLQLCVCYDKIGEKDMAYAYNERAAIYKPQDPIILKNRLYFRELQDQKTE